MPNATRPRATREAICQQCGARFLAKNSNRLFCSQLCGLHARLATAPPCGIEGCDSPVRARGLCKTHYNQTLPNRHRQQERTCEACGGRWLTYRPNGRFCSDECKGVFYSDQMRMHCKLPDHHPVMVAIKTAKESRRKLTPEPGAWRTPRECRGCGCMFSPIRTSNMLDCSRRCSNRVKDRVRRAREAGATGSWIWSDFMRIAHRFDFCCAYCGEKPSDEAVTPDHVVPLAKGGFDSAANLLPACRSCNSSKGARSLDEWAVARAKKGLPPVATHWAPEDKRYHHLTQVLLATAA